MQYACCARTRATARQKEIAVRLAIGAGRGRLIRQLLTESVLLSAVRGALGVVFAYASSRLLLGLLSSGRIDAIALDLHPDLRVFGFTSAVALATGILFGLAPAFRATASGPGLR
jgi:putative ABC transport system permease protein